MVQESTMICIDNSEWMRNGDLVPTRLQCEQEAAHLIMQCKLRSNPENAVGLLTMANDVRVLSTMTSEDRKLYTKLHEVNIEGASKFLNAIKVAHLALKHRQNRNHKMRIVMFVGSPIDHVDSSELIKLAKKLKKEKVSIDIVCFGEATAESNQVISDFIDTLNGKDGTGSHMVVVSAGSKLRDALAQSPICRGEDGTGVVPGVGFGEFGIDAEDDPELALALRVSLEEQRARQRQEQEANGEAAQGEASVEPTPKAESTRPVVDFEQMDPSTMTEEQQLEWALRMSMMQEQEGLASKKEGPTPMETEESGTSTSRTQQGPGELIEDPELLKQLVEEIPGSSSQGEDKKTEKKEDAKKT